MFYFYGMVFLYSLNKCFPEHNCVKNTSLAQRHILPSLAEKCVLILENGEIHVQTIEEELRLPKHVVVMCHESIWRIKL